MAETPQFGSIENLPVSRISFSATNPRKALDQIALEQLAESIGELGVTVPILVRPDGKDGDGEWCWTLVSGERRLRASQIAGKDYIPAIVRELADAEALDIQMVENLQRADLHPMDEAAGYQALVDAAAQRGVELTQTELAHKVGKPLSYVAQRVKLLDTIPIVQKTFSDGLINIGHALVLARLQPELQEKGLKQIFYPHGYRSKDKTAEELIEGLLQGTRPDAEYPLDAEENQHLTPIDTLASPVSKLKAWVEEKVALDLKDAPWDLASENMHPTAGSCIACAKRTGSNPALFAEFAATADCCTDPDCFAEKKKTFVAITLAAADKQGAPLPKLVHTSSNTKLDGTEKVIKQGQWVEAEEGSCPNAAKALITKGPETGSIKTVCFKQTCKVHKHRVDKAQAVTASKDRAPAYGTPAYKVYEKEQARLKQLYVDRESPIRNAVLAAVKGNLPKGANFTRDLLIDSIGNAATSLLKWWKVPGSEDLSNAYWKARGEAAPLLANHLDSLTESQLQLAIFDSLMLDLANVNDYRMDQNNADRKGLWDLARKYEVDADAVEASVRASNPDLYADPKAKVEKAPEAAVPKTAKKAAKKTAKKVAAKSTKSKARLSPEARKRIADAMAKRWAKVRAKKAKA